MCKLEECLIDCQKFFEFMDILSCAGEKVFEPNATGHMFSALTVFSDRDCLQSLERIQRF